VVLDAIGNFPRDLRDICVGLVLELCAHHFVHNFLRLYSFELFLLLRLNQKLVDGSRLLFLLLDH